MSPLYNSSVYGTRIQIYYKNIFINGKNIYEKEILRI